MTNYHYPLLVEFSADTAYSHPYESMVIHNDEQLKSIINTLPQDYFTYCKTTGIIKHVNAGNLIVIEDNSFTLGALVDFLINHLVNVKITQMLQVVNNECFGYNGEIYDLKGKKIDPGDDAVSEEVKKGFLAIGTVVANLIGMAVSLSDGIPLKCLSDIVSPVFDSAMFQCMIRAMINSGQFIEKDGHLYCVYVDKS